MKSRDKGDKRNREKEKRREERKRLESSPEWRWREAKHVEENEKGLYEVGKFYCLVGESETGRSLWTGLWPNGKRVGIVPRGKLFLLVREEEVLNVRLKKGFLWRLVICGEQIGWMKGGVLERVDDFAA